MAIILPKCINRQSFSLYIDIAEPLDLAKYSVPHGIWLRSNVWTFNLQSTFWTAAFAVLSTQLFSFMSLSQSVFGDSA